MRRPRRPSGRGKRRQLLSHSADDMNLGTRRLIAGLALLSAGLVMAGFISGADFVRFMLALVGVQ